MGKGKRVKARPQRLVRPCCRAWQPLDLFFQEGSVRIRHLRGCPRA